MSTFQSIKPSTLSRDAFVSVFADIYEHSPWVAEKAFELGQDASIDEIETLHQRMSDILLSADQQSQLALINAHPDLAGKAAVQGQLTEASTHEQAGAGIHQCTAEEFQRFTRHQILAAFETRIHNSVDTEFKCALAEINKIALFRLLTL